MLVQDIMSRQVVTIQSDDTVEKAAVSMKEHNVGALPVVDTKQQLCGIITDRDIVLRCVAPGKDLRSCSVKDVMSTSMTCVGPQQSVSEAVRLMASEQLRRLPVIDNGRLEGIITLADAASLRQSPEIANALCEIVQ